MTWSEKQTRIFLRAANLAGWNDAQRYTAMRACGCPLVAAPGTRHRASGIRSEPSAQCPVPSPSPSRPSVKAPGNTHEMFAAVMMLAESCARARGSYNGRFPRPGQHDDWIAASYDTAQRLHHKAREIWAEAQQRMPGRFFGGDEALEKFVQRIVCADTVEFRGLFTETPERLDFCDAAQAVRVVEGLRAWVGREFYRAGLTPRSFVIPRSAIEQVKAEARRHAPPAQAPGIRDQAPAEEPA